MEQLNRIEIRGNVGSVHLQAIDDRRKMARITVATNFAYKDRDGNAVIETSWHSVFAREGKNILGLDKIARGDKVYVLGRIRYQKYTGLDGVERMSAEIVAARLSVITEDGPMSYEM